MLIIPKNLTTLRECKGFSGPYVVREGQPPIEVFKNVFCVPPTPSDPRAAGIYRADGSLVEATGQYRRGLDKNALFDQSSNVVADFASAYDLPDSMYIYGGRIHAHFGHFILSTLSRLWPFSSINKPQCKILIHEVADIEELFSRPYINAILSGLGIERSDFYNCKNIAKIENLIVPSPSFVEEYCGYTEFAECCHVIGRKIIGGIDAKSVPNPVYISKSKLQSGIWRFENEYAVENVLRKHGVDIIYPEAIDFASQILLFLKHPLVIASVSSGLHASIFSWNQPKIIGISRGERVLNNFCIVDELNENHASYFSTDLYIEKETKNFSMTTFFDNPNLVAEDILRLIDSNTTGKRVKSQYMSTEANLRIAPRLGIAVTTYNRPEHLRKLIKEIKNRTNENYILVVCDDGSSEETKNILNGEECFVVSGENRGIAWNKNRGIFFLNEIALCTHMILLDDDVIIAKDGWEHEWIKAIDRFGHVAHWFSEDRGPVVGGSGTAEDPYILTLIQGQAIGLSRQAISYVGYMDNRFGKYGHEHTDYTMRFRRAGYGGVKKRDPDDMRDFFIAINGHIKVHDDVVSHQPPDITESDKFFAISQTKEITRLPWNSDEQLFEFMQEINDACERHGIAYIKNKNEFNSLDYYEINRDVQMAGMDAWEHFVNFCFREQRRFYPRTSGADSASLKSLSNREDDAFAEHMKALGYEWPPPPL